MIKVLCITRAYNIHQGGMERLSFELIEQLRQQPDIHVDLIAHTGSRRGLPWFLITATWLTLIKTSRADVIHLGDPLLAWQGWLVKAIYRKPVVVTVHGLDVVYPNVLYKLYLRLFFRHLTAYWPISRYAQTVLQNTWQPSGKITVIQPGIYDQLYTSIYTRQDLSSVLKQEVAPDQPVLLTTGRLVKRKGVAWFITHVLPHLPSNILYVVVGDGPEKDTIQQTIQQQHLEKQVMMLGRVSDADLKILYNTVDAFIQPNVKIPHDGEGFGLVLTEAALCARPVFAANLEGIPDAITDQRNGTLLPSGDAQAWIQTLTRFLQQPQTWQPSGTAARQYTQEHAIWSVRIADYAIALKQLAQQ